MYRALSELPNSKAIAGVRVGLVGDKFIVNPTTKEMEGSELDLLLAGTDSAILMIEVDSRWKLAGSIIGWRTLAMSFYTHTHTHIVLCLLEKVSDNNYNKKQ